jgi:diguanylate cyclase (GGDEF)-like protein/putative nucleotidyltransferase with HDIG domain
MREPRTPSIVDVSGSSLRLASIGVGLRVTFVMSAAGLAYAGTTWDRPDRMLILWLLAALALSGIVVALLPAARIVRSRWCEPLFLGWSLLQIAVVAGMAGADGGATSPLALAFFVPVLFAAVSYPLRSVVVVGAVDVLTFLGLDVLTGPSDPGYLLFFSGALALGATLCAAQAQNQERQREELARVSRTDPLTGALNRRGFHERLDAEISSARRTGRHVSVVVWDLDAFKEVNDRQGHPAGDDLLRWAVQAASGVVRPVDDIGRLGGDEFALLLPNALRVDADTVAERLGAALSERIGASIGVTSFPLEATDREELLHNADAQLYAAKDGRPRESGAKPRDLSWAAALALAVDSRMAVDHQHSSAVAEHAGAIAAKLGWSDYDLGLLRMAAMLHDVGKVSVPDAILRKSGPLTQEEFTEVAKHPGAGAEIVARVDTLAPIVPWIRHAHEHWDGSGYPDGLVGEAIPQAARILLVADAFDAMTSNRPYRAAMSEEDAREELRGNAGTMFDPRCVELLERHLDSLTVDRVALRNQV